MTWAQTDTHARQIAAGLVALGVDAEDRVAIASSTRLEWVLADLGNMLAGAATTTVYPTSQLADVVHILTDSGSRVVFAEDTDQVEKLRSGREQIPDVVKVVVFVASTPDFTGQPQVANGASELFGQVFGDAGVHARSAVGVPVLPLDSPVEVELVVEV